MESLFSSYFSSPNTSSAIEADEHAPWLPKSIVLANQSNHPIVSADIPASEVIPKTKNGWLTNAWYYIGAWPWLIWYCNFKGFFYVWFENGEISWFTECLSEYQLMKYVI